MTDITDHLARVNERIRQALAATGRPDDAVTLVAVSKRQPVSAIEAAFRAGQRHFGESYAQEALAKMQELNGLPIVWHYIGRVQANKARVIAQHFQWVHTVDRVRIASRLNEHRPYHAPPLNVLLQVNQADEQQKAGVSAAQVQELARAVEPLPRLRLRGLMSMPPAACSMEETAQLFGRLGALKEDLAEAGIPMDQLSMGMSADFETAIAEGATLVRIGSAIFGARDE